MSQCDQLTEQDQRTDRANTIVSMLVGSVLLGIGGVVLWQNSATLKVPDRNKLWADTWKKQLSKPWEMPKAEGAIDWSDPKNDPSKLASQPWAQPNPIFQELREHQGMPTNFGKH
jgi:hypothetical protein